MAPIKAGDKFAELIVETKHYGTQSYPIVAKNSVNKAGFFDRIKLNFARLFE